MTISTDYTAASQALGTQRFTVPKAYQHISEAQGLEWTDQFFTEEEGIVAVFDFDYAQMVDFNFQTAAVGQMASLGCCSLYGLILFGPIFAPIAPVAITMATLWPCFLKKQVEWAAHAQHVAITRDGIRFVQDQRPSCWGCSVCDKGRHSKTVPFDKITDCDIIEPAGSAFLCIPRVLLTVNVDTASSGGESKRFELKLIGLKDAVSFKRLVWAMKRSSRGGTNLFVNENNAYAAPQALEMVERGTTGPTSDESAGTNGDKMEFLLRDIREELRENNRLLRDIKSDKNDPLQQQSQNVASIEAASSAVTERATATLQILDKNDEQASAAREIV